MCVSRREGACGHKELLALRLVLSRERFGLCAWDGPVLLGTIRSKGFSSWGILAHTWPQILMTISVEFRRPASPPRLCPFRGDGADAPWLLCVGDVPGSAAPAWEMGEKRVDGSDLVFFSPKVMGARLSWLVPVRIESMEGMVFDWRSPSAYLSEHPRLSAMDCGIIAIPVSSPEPLLKAAARTGFGTLSKTNLAAIMSDLGYSADMSKSTFDICYQLVKVVLEVDDKGVLEVMGKRIAQMDAHNTRCVDESLALDEGNCGIDKAEIQDMQEKKKHTMQTIKEVAEFEGEYRKKYSFVFPRQPAPKPKRGAGRKGQGGKGGARVPEALPQCDLSQATLLPFCPDGGFVWKSRSGSWQCHFPPFPRRSFSWTTYGDRQAALLCSRELWTAYNSVHGLPEENCPWPEIFAVDAQGLLAAAGR